MSYWLTPDADHLMRERVLTLGNYLIKKRALILAFVICALQGGMNHEALRTGECEECAFKFVFQREEEAVHGPC